MATVTLAQDTLLGRPVALKRMIGTADTQGMSRLRREALVGASVSHPNLVSIYDVLSEDEDVVLVMEYVDGATLKETLTQHGPLAPAEAVRVLNGVAGALDAIHQRRIVHRDVKPQNILLGKGGEVKLADLGIAADPDRTSITTEGSILGSFSYMSPEQLEGASPDPAMDVYALSAVAFEALSARRARQEDNPLALAHATATQPPPDLSDAWPEAPQAATALLKRGMSRNSDERPRSAGELVQRLEAALTPDPGPQQTTQALSPVPVAALVDRGSPTSATRPTRRAQAGGEPPVAPILTPDSESPRRRRRSGWLAPVLLGLVALAVLVAVLASSGSTPKPAASSHRTAPTHQTQAAKTSTGASHPLPPPTTGSSQPPGGATTNPPATSSTMAGAGTAVTAVERFYELAASHRYPAAWALADPAFRSQLDGYDSFASGQSGDRRIIFHSARVRSQIRSTSTAAEPGGAAAVRRSFASS
jgi:serine/threonine protein kinase